MEDEELKKVVDNPSLFDFFILQDGFLFKGVKLYILRVLKRT